MGNKVTSRFMISKVRLDVDYQSIHKPGNINAFEEDEKKETKGLWGPKASTPKDKGEGENEERNNNEHLEDKSRVYTPPLSFFLCFFRPRQTKKNRVRTVCRFLYTHGFHRRDGFLERNLFGIR